MSLIAAFGSASLDAVARQALAERRDDDRRGRPRPPRRPAVRSSTRWSRLEGRRPRALAARHHRAAAHGAGPPRLRREHQPRAAHAADLDQAAGRDALIWSGRRPGHHARLRDPGRARGRSPRAAGRRAARPLDDRVRRDEALDRGARPRRRWSRPASSASARSRSGARSACHPCLQRAASRARALGDPGTARSGAPEPRAQRREVQPPRRRGSHRLGARPTIGYDSPSSTTASACRTAHQARIFERFYKVDRSREPASRTSSSWAAAPGSASPSCATSPRRMAERSGLSSEEGVGSTFWIEVPRADG